MKLKKLVTYKGGWVKNRKKVGREWVAGMRMEWHFFKNIIFILYWSIVDLWSGTFLVYLFK